jgi:hypothetical protein
VIRYPELSISGHLCSKLGHGHRFRGILGSGGYDFNAWSARKCAEKLRYIHRNPVKRGLVEAPDQWPWSSFRAYAYGEEGMVAVKIA